MEIEFLKDIDPKKYFPESKYIIEYSFSLGDRHYFKFHDSFNIPSARALTTIVFYSELDLNFDRSFAEAATDAAIGCLKPKVDENGDLSIDVENATKVLRMMKQRLAMPKETELMYNLAAVVFFDQYENPNNYEYGYGQEKKQYWKQHCGLDVFFSALPIVQLMPYLEHARENLIAFDRMVKEQNQFDLTLLREKLSSEQWTTLKQSSVLHLGEM